MLAELVFLGRHVHWTLTELRALTRVERTQFIDEVIRQLPKK